MPSFAISKSLICHENQTKRIRVCLSRCYRIICVIGFLYHINEIISIFMSHGTRSHVTFGMDDILPMPNCVVCATYIDILNRTDYKKYGLFPKKPASANDQAYEQSRLTVREIFHLTPNPNKSINKCLLRIGDTFRMEYYNTTDCQSRMNVRKFLMQEYICYSFTPNNSRNYSITWVTHSLLNSMHLFDFVLTDDFATSSQILPIVSERVGERIDYPLFSRNFAKPVFRFQSHIVQDSSTLISNLYRLFHSTYRVQLLSYPYDTDCTKDNPRHECIRKCVTQKSLILHRAPFTEMVFDELDIKIISPDDLKNKSVEDTIGKVHVYCSNQCSRETCFKSFSTTSIQPIRSDTVGNSMRFEVFTPETPITSIDTEPSLTFIDFIIYSCSCIGLWFGISIFSLNPTKLKPPQKIMNLSLKKKEKMKEKTRWKLVRPCTIHRSQFTDPNEMARFRCRHVH